MRYLAAGVAVVAVLAIAVWDWRRQRTPRRYKVWSASRNAEVWNDELDVKGEERDL